MTYPGSEIIKCNILWTFGKRWLQIDKLWPDFINILKTLQATENEENVIRCHICTRCVDGTLVFKLKLKIFYSNWSFDLFSSASFWGVLWLGEYVFFHMKEFTVFYFNKSLLLNGYDRILLCKLLFIIGNDLR